MKKNSKTWLWGASVVASLLVVLGFVGNYFDIFNPVTVTLFVKQTDSFWNIAPSIELPFFTLAISLTVLLFLLVFGFIKLIRHINPDKFSDFMSGLTQGLIWGLTAVMFAYIYYGYNNNTHNFSYDILIGGFVAVLFGARMGMGHGYRSNIRAAVGLSIGSGMIYGLLVGTRQGLVPVIALAILTALVTGFIGYALGREYRIWKIAHYKAQKADKASLKPTEQSRRAHHAVN